MEKLMKTPAKMRAGWFIAQALFSAVTCIEIYYYTDWMTNIALIPLVTIGMIKLITAVLDWISSLVLPVIMQKLRLPLGKYRTYFAIFPAIYCVFGALAITKVSDTNMAINVLVLIVSYFISRFMWNLTDAASSTFTSVAAEQYSDAQTVLSMWRGRGSASSSLWFGAISGVLIGLLASAGLAKENPMQFSVLALIWFAINIVGYQVLFHTTKDLKKRDMEELNAESRSGQRVTMIDIFKAVGTNRPLLLLWIYDVFRQLSMFYVSGVTMFYLRFSLQLEDAAVKMSTYILISGVAAFVGSFVAAAIVKVLGTKKTLLLSMFGGAVVGIILYIVNIRNFWAVTAIRAITGLFLGGSLVLITKTYADCSIYGEYMTGKDVRATVMATFPIPIKIMSIIIGLVTTAAIAFGFGGVLPGDAMENVSLIDYAATRRFDFIFFVIPAIASIIAGCCMLLYPADKKFREWSDAINERKGAAPAKIQ
jgi:Na+/melibiose symporter-like transporter